MWFDRILCIRKVDVYEPRFDILRWAYFPKSSYAHITFYNYTFVLFIWLFMYRKVIFKRHLKPNGIGATNCCSFSWSFQTISSDFTFLRLACEAKLLRCFETEVGNVESHGYYSHRAYGSEALEIYTHLTDACRLAWRGALKLVFLFVCYRQLWC